MAKPQDKTFYIKSLRSDECLCEHPKKPGFSFCFKCYKSLPVDMQRALYQGMGDGYEGAVDEACKYLQTEVW